MASKEVTAYVNGYKASCIGKYADTKVYAWTDKHGFQNVALFDKQTMKNVGIEDHCITFKAKKTVFSIHGYEVVVESGSPVLVYKNSSGQYTFNLEKFLDSSCKAFPVYAVPVYTDNLLRSAASGKFKELGYKMSDSPMSWYSKKQPGFVQTNKHGDFYFTNGPALVSKKLTLEDLFQMEEVKIELYNEGNFGCVNIVRRGGKVYIEGKELCDGTFQSLKEYCGLKD